MAGRRTAQEQRDYMREYRARKRLEQQTSKGITEGVTGVTSVANVHAACDRRIAELEAEVRRLSGRQASTKAVDTSTVKDDVAAATMPNVAVMPAFTGVEDLEDPVLREVAERINAVPGPIERTDIDTSTQDVRHYDAAGNLVKVLTYEERIAAGLKGITGTHTGLIDRASGDITHVWIDADTAKPASKPAFLAAKVDDCVSCGHEWHSNEDAGCRAAKGPRDRCGCKAYLNEGEPF